MTKKPIDYPIRASFANAQLACSTTGSLGSGPQQCSEHAWREAALEHARQEFPRESCGLVIEQAGREVYVRANNRAADRHAHFILDPEDYARAADQGRIVAVVHSHPNASANLSEADKVQAENSGLPWHVVGLPSGVWKSYVPCGYRPPLVGRTYAYGTLDCFSLVRDAMQELYGIEFEDFTRNDPDWHRKGQNHYVENFTQAGFIELDAKVL